uniref:Uncharacterized protein n=1 Tax=Avena sativa TaxID=4498 RepID=A0ACD5XYT6_AVESA
MWFDLCHAYFEMYSIPRHQWLPVASLYFFGHAALWWQAYKRCHAVMNWEVLCAAIVEEFGQDEYDIQISKLHHLRQTSTVLEYWIAFETIMYQLISPDPSLNTKFFVSQFVIGLKDELRTAMRLQAPSSVTHAVSLARIQEEEFELHRPRQRVIPSGKSPVTSLTNSSSIAASASGTKCNADDYGRECQSRDYRRANGLCFRCGDKYNKDHQCKKPMQLLTIHLGEFGEVFTEDIVQALELLNEPESDTGTVQCCHLSLQAVSGGEANDTIHLRAQVGNQVMITLIDSGSSHSFINTEFARLANYSITATTTTQVKMANGSLVCCDKQVCALPWSTQGYTFHTDMRVLELGGYAAVLGMDWLQSYSPMTIDWIDKSLKIPHNGSEAHLQGIRSSSMTLSSMTVEELRNAHAGNDIWALAVVELDATQPEASPSAVVPPDLAELLTEFKDVFATPSSLPPHRVYDHAVSLEAQHAPIN